MAGQPGPAHRRQIRTTLAVPQLTDVVVPKPGGGTAPAQETVRRTLGEALSGNDSAARMIELRRREMGLEDRGCGLLDLQHDPVVGRGARRLEQGHPDQRPDAAHPHHPARHVEEPITAHQHLLVVGQAAQVVVDHTDGLVHAAAQRLQPHGDRRNLAEPDRSIDAGLRQPAHGSIMPTPEGLGDVAFHLLPGLRVVLGEHVVDALVVVPDLQVGHPRVPGDLVAIHPHGVHHEVVTGGGRQALGRGDNVQAGGEALDVPFPRSRQRLVEIIDGERFSALRGGERAEVADVRVAAELHPDPGARRRHEVGGHHRGGAAEEPERRLGHPGVADPDRGRTLVRRPGRRGCRPDRGRARRRLRHATSVERPCAARVPPHGGQRRLDRARGRRAAAVLCPSRSSVAGLASDRTLLPERWLRWSRLVASIVRCAPHCRHNWVSRRHGRRAHPTRRHRRPKGSRPDPRS